MTMLTGIYGTGGCGRVVMPFLRDAVAGAADTFVFIEDVPQETATNGHAVYSWAAFLAAPHPKQVCVAIANSVVRERLVEKCIAAGLLWVGVQSRLALILDNVQIGEAAIISPFATIGSNARIGRGLLADLYSCINHDCLVGDFVTLAPFANCNGNVVIEDHAYIGAGAVIKQGQPGKPLIIGRGAIIGMGAVVTRDVPPGVTVVGNPARPLAKE